jgi:hypothetical protein
MEKNLQYLIDCAKKHQITPSEREAQVRSFAYGNTRIENEAITKADIDRAMTSLKSEREPVEPVRT